eukprot:9850736-Alexandrium_andersonii.AAC.1
MRCAPPYGAGVLRAMLHRLRRCRTWRGRVHNVVPHAWVPTCTVETSDLVARTCAHSCHNSESLGLSAREAATHLSLYLARLRGSDWTPP